MYIDQTKYTTRPTGGRIPQEFAIYDRLEELSIPYVRVDHDHADTIEICHEVEKVLGAQICKNLFLCNRQQTAFYLFITNGNKPFRAKDFSAALDIARVSFAPAELMEQKLGTKIGAATVFSSLLDTENAVQIVFDRDVLSEEWYGCSDGTTTGYMKVKTNQILHQFLPYTKHAPLIVAV